MRSSLGPASKLFLSVAFAVAVLHVERGTGLAIFAALTLLGAWEGRVPLRRVLGLLIPLSPLVIVAALHASWAATVAPAAASGPSLGGLSPLGRGLLTAARLTLLVAGPGLTSLSTSPLGLLEALFLLLDPLRRLGLPTRELAWTALLALRFLPLVQEELATVLLARRARGSGLHRPEWRVPMRSLLAVAVPLAVRALRRADELAAALEARGFRVERATPRRQAWAPAEATVVLGGLLLMAWAAWRY